MKDSKEMSGVKWRLAVTLFGSIGTLIFLIVYLAFFPHGLSLWQSIAVVIISLLVLGAIMAGIWIPWNDLGSLEELDDLDDYWEKKGKKKK